VAGISDYRCSYRRTRSCSSHSSDKAVPQKRNEASPNQDLSRQKIILSETLGTDPATDNSGKVDTVASSQNLGVFWAGSFRIVTFQGKAGLSEVATLEFVPWRALTALSGRLAPFFWQNKGTLNFAHVRREKEASAAIIPSHVRYLFLKSDTVCSEVMMDVVPRFQVTVTYFSAAETTQPVCHLHKGVR
jgi:hypothetical protein